MRRQLVNLVLAAIAVASVVAFFLTSGKVTTNEKKARENNLLVAYREDDITHIEIEHPGQPKPKLVLDRSAPDDAGDTDWRITAPTRGEAEPFAVNKLLGSLEFATAVRRIKPAEVDKHAFGLDAPRMVVRVTMGNIHYVLSLGKAAAKPAGSAYVQVGGDGAPEPGVSVVKQSLVKELDIGADQLRGPQIMPYISSALSRIEVDGPGGLRKLVKVGDNLWRFDGMQDNLRVERQALDRVLLQFARTKADHFIDPGVAAKAQAGAVTARISMTPDDKQQPKGVVVVGGACPDSKDDVVALRIEPDKLAACVPSNVMPGLSTPVADLVDRSIFSLRPDEVESLAIKRGDRELVMDRTGSGFLMRKPRHAAVDLEAGNQRVTALTDARGKLEPDAKLEPDGKVTLKSAAESDAKVVTEQLLVGKPDKDGSVLVKRESDGAMLRLDRDTARALAADASLIKSRKILDFGGKDFKKLELRVGDAHEEIVQNEFAQLELDKPKGFTIDAGLASDIVNALGTLVADRWVADKDDGSFGLDKPSVDLVLTIKNGDAGTQTHHIIVGAPTSGGAFARVDDDPGVFVLPKDALEKIETLAFDRSVFLLPEATTRVEFEHGKTRVTLDRRGSVFVQSGGTDQLGPARVQRLTVGMSNLRAEAAIHVGAAKPSEGFAKPELVVRVTVGSEDGGATTTHVWRIGAGDSWRDISIYYARAEGTDATYVIARSKVREVIDSL